MRKGRGDFTERMTTAELWLLRVFPIGELIADAVKKLHIALSWVLLE